MDHLDHVRLIRDGVAGHGSTWADLGSGTGSFTLALADLLGADGTIYSVDRDRHALDSQVRTVSELFPHVALHPLVADFSKPIDLPALDGVVMANSLHFQKDKRPVLELVRELLRDGGHLVLVEYDSDRGNPWVPYPISWQAWRTLAQAAGFHETRQLERVPSRFLGAIYSAVSVR